MQNLQEEQLENQPAISLPSISGPNSKHEQQKYSEQLKLNSILRQLKIESNRKQAELKKIKQ